MQLLKDPCPGNTTLSLVFIVLRSDVTSMFTLSFATSFKRINYRTYVS